MQIPYRPIGDYEPVDLQRLRPKDSYRALMQKRTHSIDALVAAHGRIPPELLVERPCPTCGGTKSLPESSKDYMSIVRCARCNLVYVNPVFDEQHYRKVYGSADYQAIMRDLGEESHVYRVERFGRERVAIMQKFMPELREPVRYLDVGCSTGFVVEAAAAAGWRATGIDLNPSAIEFGRQRGLDLHVAALEDEPFQPGSFQAVSLFDVLEHLPHPGAVVDACLRLLGPGGILLLYVPNYDSASRLLMGTDA
ncbi:MAG: class I SAM-dependent methyltransferase, partial [Acidobacteria bacterium]|nr:class I SAM-dependent methyltransferase [Acidobacteriota bacterium]